MRGLSLSGKLLGVALLCGAGIWSAPASPAPGSSAADRQLDTSGNRLRIGVVADSEPSYFVDETGQAGGFDYEIGKALAKELGVPEVAFVEGDNDQLPQLLRAGEADIIMGGYIPDEGIQGLVWSQGYLDFGLCLIVRQDSFIRNYRQLRNRRVAIVDDPAAERWVSKNIPRVKVEKFAGGSGWFEAVERREVAALIYDYPLAVAQIRRYPSTRIVQFDLNQSHYAIGMAETNSALKPRIDRALNAIVASADYESWVRTYFSYTPASALTPRIMASEPALDEGEPELAEVGPAPDTESLADDERALDHVESVPEEVNNGPPQAAYRSYVVQEGDTLAGVATRELGSLYRWYEIWQLNRAELANPDVLMVGTTLTLPR